MSKYLTLTVLLLSLSMPVHAQQIGEIELKESGFGQKKLSKAPKKIFISEFNINYQLAYSQTSIARGGRELGGGYRGDATASLSVAIPDIDLNELQKITDRAYEDFVSTLKAKGFEIVEPDVAAQTELLSDWERLPGGHISEAQFPGYIATMPSGRDFFVRRITKKGRTKNGVFEYATKLSKQLDGAIIVKMNLAIPFVEEAEGGVSKSLRKTIGGLAKVVVKPNFRLANYESVQVSQTNTLTIQTNSSYIYMESLKDQAQVQHALKKDVEIGGVFEDKKYKAMQKADQDLWGSGNGFYTVFSYDDRELEKTQAIPCDPQKYLSGVGQVISGYVKNSLNGFLEAYESK
ncbi:hypothetical protein [Roseivirga thermotolerans]|uniref:hypothetical protein n=1 Tax=Roseivirga thermotolerans TaxID=1758176 RepID=UPI00273F5EF5|nr:hypothetical protein [Roseivirga thermotolerans]